MSYVEQELHTLLENLNSFPVVSEVRVARSLAFCVMYCRQLFVIFAFFFWPLYCLLFFSSIYESDWPFGIFKFVLRQRLALYHMIAGVFPLCS